MPGLIALSTSDNRPDGNRPHFALGRWDLRARCNSAHWVYLARPTTDISNYYIIDDRSARPGDTVCLTGSRGAPRWGTSCGEVTKLQAGGKYKVLAKGVCATYGDSGGPYFAGHVAFGIEEGGTIECQPDIADEQYFTDIEAAETLMNVNVIHGG
jgi:hypothetical protein